MHCILVEECAARQGCCARKYGCCLDRKTLPSRSLGIGHCTLECACYQRARGFRPSPAEKKYIKDHFLNAGKDRGHRITSYQQVSIWGLVGDNRDEPFDMIDALPSYNHSEKKGMKGLLD
jgi:hypothetical protein